MPMWPSATKLTDAGSETKKHILAIKDNLTAYFDLLQ